MFNALSDKERADAIPLEERLPSGFGVEESVSYGERAFERMEDRLERSASLLRKMYWDAPWGTDRAIRRDLQEAMDLLEEGLGALQELGPDMDPEQLRMLDRAVFLSERLAVGRLDSEDKLTAKNIAKLLGYPDGKIPGGSAFNCVAIRLLRSMGIPRGRARRYLRACTGTFSRPSTVDAYCEPAKFPAPWRSRTANQRVIGGSEVYEKQRSRWKRLADSLLVSRKEHEQAERWLKSLSPKEAKKARDSARDSIRKLLKSKFHRVVRHVPDESSPNRELISRLFTEEVAEGFVERVVDSHTQSSSRGRELIKDAAEDALIGCIGDYSGAEVEDERSSTDPQDMRATLKIGGRKRAVNAQIKTSFSDTDANRAKSGSDHGDETKDYEFSLFDTGAEVASDGHEMARRAAERMEETDLYIYCNVLHDNEGLTKDNNPDTVTYSTEVMRDEVRQGIIEGLKGHDFDYEPSRLVVSGEIMVDGVPTRWSAAVTRSGNGISVAVSPDGMEAVMTASVPAPRVARRLMAAKAKALFGKKRR